MKNYTITVNGTVYDVTVEEGGMVSAPVRAAAPKAAAGAGDVKGEGLGKMNKDKKAEDKKDNKAEKTEEKKDEKTEEKTEEKSTENNTSETAVAANSSDDMKKTKTA